MRLTERDEQMLAGDCGPAIGMAMAILVQLGDVIGAEEMMEISQAHIDGCIYEGEANLDFAERLAQLGGQVTVPTTLNATSLDLHNWQAWGVDREYAGKASRLAKAYTDMGAIPTWTCAPYQTAYLPVFGQQIAWAESNAIVFANSVIGARTNRYGDFTDICAALTGRVPKFGLHLSKNRTGQMLFSLHGIPHELLADDAFYAVLGHFIGKATGERIPVIEGLPEEVGEDQLKALGAAAASSGAVAMFHAVGITPEAPTLEVAFGGGTPESTIEVTTEDLRAARSDLSTWHEKTLDAVVLGSPHFSLNECLRLATLIEGKRVHPAVEFIVTTNRIVRSALEARGILPVLDQAGVRLCEDTCILLSPILRKDIRVLMTNSAKYAYYSPGKLDRKVTFGSLRECVESAIAGEVVRLESLWEA